MSIGNPVLDNYSLQQRPGWLRLRPTTQSIDSPQSPTFVARRQTETRFVATARLDVSHLSESMQTGLTAYAAPLNHYDVVLEKQGGQLVAKANIRLGELSHSEKSLPLSGDIVYLQISSDQDYYYLKASSDGQNFHTLTRMDFRYLSTEVIGGFTGVMLGLFAQSDQADCPGFVDVDWLEYKTTK
jgi:alpha-N-arabinofuranosidase